MAGMMTGEPRTSLPSSCAELLDQLSHQCVPSALD